MNINVITTRKRKTVNTGITLRNRLERQASLKRRKIAYEPVPIRQCNNNNTAISGIRSRFTKKKVYKVEIKHGFLLIRDPSHPKTYIRGRPRKNSLYFILINGYSTSGTHSRHLVSAIEYNGCLYFFDPWGRDRLPVSDNIARELAVRIGIRELKMYNGRNLQERNRNSIGVCVGYSHDFLSMFGNSRLNTSTFNTLVSNKFRSNANNPLTMLRGLRQVETGYITNIRRNV